MDICQNGMKKKNENTFQVFIYNLQYFIEQSVQPFLCGPCNKARIRSIIINSTIRNVGIRK